MKSDTGWESHDSEVIVLTSVYEVRQLIQDDLFSWQASIEYRSSDYFTIISCQSSTSWCFILLWVYLWVTEAHYELLQLHGRSHWHVHYCCQLSQDCCGNITQVPFGFALSCQKKITAAFIPLAQWLLKEWTLTLKCEKCRWLFPTYSPWKFLMQSNPVLGTWWYPEVAVVMAVHFTAQLIPSHHIAFVPVVCSLFT